jgi:hypothetical protein
MQEMDDVPTSFIHRITLLTQIKYHGRKFQNLPVRITLASVMGTSIGGSNYNSGAISLTWKLIILPHPVVQYCMIEKALQSLLTADTSAALQKSRHITSKRAKDMASS